MKSFEELGYSIENGLIDAYRKKCIDMYGQIDTPLSYAERVKSIINKLDYPVKNPAVKTKEALILSATALAVECIHYETWGRVYSSQKMKDAYSSEDIYPNVVMDEPDIERDMNDLMRVHHVSMDTCKSVYTMLNDVMVRRAMDRASELSYPLKETVMTGWAMQKYGLVLKPHSSFVTDMKTLLSFSAVLLSSEFMDILTIAWDL